MKMCPYAHTQHIHTPNTNLFAFILNVPCGLLWLLYSNTLEMKQLHIVLLSVSPPPPLP